MSAAASTTTSATATTDVTTVATAAITVTPPVTNNVQKDYHSLSSQNGSDGGQQQTHQHAHQQQRLNRLKSSSNSSINVSLNNGNSNSSVTGNGGSVLSNGANSVINKRSSMVIGDGNCGEIDQLPQMQHQQQQQSHHMHQFHKNGIFAMNSFRQTHLHNHHRGSGSSLSSGSSGISAGMRKSYPSSDPSNSSFSSASVAGSIQDDNMSDRCGSSAGLTQAGLEEYNSRSYYDQPVFHHQKQSSYAQSEGYHSYVSSSDSSSATPFLDRLRQETELLSRQSHHWSQNDLSSPTSANNNSTGCSTNPTIDNNSNESTSSTETLKWLGSTSDISVASHATNSSAISGSVSSSSQLIVHSSRVLTPKRHNSESVLYMNDDQMSVTSESSNIVNCNKTTILYQQQHLHHQHYHPSPLPPLVSSHHKANGLDHHHSHQHQHHRQSPSSVTIPPTSSLGSAGAPSPGSLSASGSPTSTTPSSVPVTSTATSTTPPAASQSYRNNHRLFPVSTYAESVNGTATIDYPHQQHQLHQAQHHHSHHHQQPQTATAQPQQPMTPVKLSSPQSHNWQSVADRINDFERQQQSTPTATNNHHHNHQTVQHQLPHRYTFIDPSKTHRVPNPALKAFQKNAVQSYFERQQQNAYSSPKSPQQQQAPPLPPANGTQQNRPQSLQLAATHKEMFPPKMRTSLPNNCPISNYSNRNGPSAQQIINSSHLRSPVNDDSAPYVESNCSAPPPPPPRSRSLMPVRRSSSASEYAEFRECFVRAKDKPSLSTVTSPEKLSFNDCGVPPPPPPPPRGRISMPVRRTSSASEYVAFREKNLKVRQNLQKDFHAAMIMGPIISVDDWVPERPPKNPNLRIPSPDLPPPPLLTPDIDTNLPNQDEPLPPPPPEILRHIRQSSDGEQKPPAQSRRNSFAGSTSQKPLYRTSTLDNLSPPVVPKKPSSMDVLHVRPASSMAHSHKAHKVILNGKLESPSSPSGPKSPIVAPPVELPLTRPVDPRASVRKRSHNSYPIPPPGIDTKPSPSKVNGATTPVSVKSPPPLKPRMPIAGQEMRASSVAISSKLRRNSKASYLPRQTTDKLINATDPDHGSYKLTLTSNEDSINHSTSSFHEDILSSKCNNLPDVLPVGVKMQPSPSSSSSSSPRYGSNNNINMVTPPHTAPAIISGSYPMKSLFHFQPPTMQASVTQQHNNRLTSSPLSASPPSYSMAVLNRSTSSPMNSNDSMSPKYMSQSTIDLKKTHIFESVEEPAKILSPAQSESNIIAQDKPRSPYSAKREYRKAEVARKLSLEDKKKDEGRIVRAELVNTVLSSSPPVTKLEEKPICKDSLRGNIEKITQLQSKLMSAHLVESSTDRTLLGFTGKTVEIKSKIIEKEPIKSTEPRSPPPQTDGSSASSPEVSESERISKMDTEIDGLKLMQRTEIILRLNAPTMEAASQTDETLEAELSRVKLTDSTKEPSDDTKLDAPKSPPPVELKARQKHPEEIDCDNLSKELISHLAPSDKLHQILAPKQFKSSGDYVSGLYNSKIMPRSVKRDVSTSTPSASCNGMAATSTDCKTEKSDKSVGCELKNSTSVECPPTETVTKNEHAMTNGVNEGKTKSSTTRCNQELTLVNGECADGGDLGKKKEELVNRITKKLLVLSNEQSTIAEESSTNDQLGNELTTKVADKLRPIDATKFRAYIDDVGHITMLLLSLSGRLARVENALHGDIENNAEKKIIEVKRDRLTEQLEEAKRLKEDIDRRGTIVCKILEKNLTADEYADYDYFINMKAKLIVDSRENADKIKVSEEQLKALKDNLVQSEC